LGEVHAEAAQATGLPQGTPVILGGHDHLCGALPVGAIKPGVVLDVTGTWESVIAATSQPVLKPELCASGMTVQAHVARGMHATWGGNVAADMLEWYRRELGSEATHKANTEGGADWDYLIAAAASSPAGARRVMFLPHMSAASCPVVDPKSMGAFVGLTNLVTSGDMFRAIIEGLDYQFLDIVTSLESGLGTKLERVIAVGGATRNEFWMQNKADVTGRSIEVPAVEEATPLGAAILAGIGLGLYRDEQDAYERVYKAGKTYHPDMDLHARYAEGFQIYKKLYSGLAPIHHRLFDRSGS
jgi:xylulokinase